MSNFTRNRGSLVFVMLTLLIGGCSQVNKSSQTESFNAEGPNRCYAKAMPTKGHGGSAWAPTMGQARTDAMNACYKFAGQSGGTPQTCKIVEARCS
ncbi:DUF4189 domain-containing protein [Pseudomonas sp. P115]|nr:DUF4189 domain-containing protein [Pseudomonas pisciculturae]